MPAQSDDLLIVERGGTLYKATVGEVAALAGGGGSPLGLADFWTENVFATTDVSQPPFLGAVVSGGTTNAPLAGSLDGAFPYGVRIRDGASANSGYRYQTSSLVADTFGITSRKFQAQLRYVISHSAQAMVGFFDRTSPGDPTDGAFFSITPNNIQARCFSGGVQTFTTTTVITSGDCYTLDIDVPDSGASVRFRAWKNTSPTPVFDETVTANVPTGVNAFGAGILAWTSAGGFGDLMILHRMGFGTIAGYNRARG